MRVPMLATIACVAVSAACQPVAEFNPDDPETISAINSVIEGAMEGARNVDADRVLAAAEGEG